MRKRGIVPVLAIMLVFEIGLAFAIVLAQPNGLGSLLNFGFGPEKQQVQPVQVFELKGAPSTLTINGGSGRVIITGDEKATALTINAVKLSHSNTSEAFDRIKYEVSRTGDNINILAEKGEPQVGFSLGERLELTITAPRNTTISTKMGSGEVRVSDLENRGQAYNFETGSGNLLLSNLQTKTLRVKTGSGAISLNSTVGKLDAETGSGNISLNGVQGELARLKTSSGNIKLDAVTAALNAETGSGDIRVTKADVQDLRLKTGSGSVYFDGQANINKSAEVGTGSGNVELNFSSLGIKLPRFDVSTGSGDINFKVAGANIEQKDKHHLTTANDGPPMMIKTGSGGVKVTG